MKKTVFINIFIFFSSALFSQSKKEQIQILKFKVDSLNTILSSERNLNSQKIKSLDSSILILKNTNVNLNNDLSKVNNTLKINESKKNILSKELDLKSSENKLLKLEIKKLDSVYSSNNNEYNKICKVFLDWKNKKISNNEYLSIVNCNSEYVMKNNSELQPIDAIPDEIQFLYGDLNNDNKLDALVWFSIIQCDGGNGCMYCKEVILIVSKENDYLIDEDFDNEIESKHDLILFDYYSITENSINGYYSTLNYENRFSKLKGMFSVNYKDRKVYFY